MAANRMPIAVSSLTRRLRLIAAMPSAVTKPTASAPSRMLRPTATATTMPGNTAWVSASPMKARPRSTT
jgi:hypothetical protein